jgi:glycosyltransferase involved in cell wall biosynthesis
MPRILKDCPKAKFLIVGDGRLKNELESEVKKLNVEKSVFFIPNQPDTIKILSIMDCVVSPSVQEGLGLSILEAQAAGVPVVAFATGGIVSLIENERTGLLVKPLDTEALAETLIRLLGDLKLRQRLIKDARLNVMENFNTGRTVEATNNLYSKILKGSLRQ